MELKGSRTEKNLLTAFAGESQARNVYLFCQRSEKEGYEQIATIFRKQPTTKKNTPNYGSKNSDILAQPPKT